PLAGISLMLSNEKTGPQERAHLVTEDAFKTLVDVGQQDGTLEQDESKMIQSIFRLDDTLTREIMVPRIDVQALDINTPLEEALDLLLSSGYSRLPVYDESIDRILGLLYAKDLLKIWGADKEQRDIKRDFLRKPYFVPEAKKVDELLAELQKRRVHMAIVVDEYGGVAGVVTLEDIIEEIFGEIQDEYDEEEELPYRKLEDGSYIFRGRVDLDDFNEIMESNLPIDEADTLGGFIYAYLGHVPVKGEQIMGNGLLLTVEHVSDRRIRKVHAERIETQDQGQDDH
ncbi:MAG: hemolysin family protein, partial [Chloroflexota bacterium]